MRVTCKEGLKWGVPLLVISVIGLFRFFPAGAEWYARTCYPVVSAVLSAVSSVFPFSLGDCLIAGACLWVVIYPLYAWRKRKGVWCTVSVVVRFLMWVYIWFYLAWGVNYFRLSFYDRTGIARADYSAEEFSAFLDDYVSRLNDAYDTALPLRDSTWFTVPYRIAGERRNEAVAGEVVSGYRRIAPVFGMVSPRKLLYPKWMLWSGGMSRVGVSGYMGPFLSEFNLNRDLLNVEYPFTYAHELAHRLGIAGEAEANLYAALVTTGSESPEIRFSGYFSLFGYIMNNARRFLPDEEYAALLRRVHPGVVDMYRAHLIYWRGKYNPSAGKVQNKVYNAYLKGNKIVSGTRNYSEVVGLLMSLRQAGGVRTLKTH